VQLAFQLAILEFYLEMLLFGRWVVNFANQKMLIVSISKKWEFLIALLHV